ncbi:fimbrillin family protein [Bacteroides sp. 51]|uniref:fimbrillin family protein n=1 Tax=Bacteroides sp. 51 TaxID=2302938 RepID=UPI0013D57B2F|nr:fimbrillin family protein [Bacteroides sp. 51]
MQTISQYRINICGAVLFLLVVLFFAGCSAEDTDIGNGTNGEAITFSCSTTPDMRASETTADNMQYFRVSAIWNKGGVNNYASFMDNQLVEKQGDGWVYSPTKYWPGYGTVSFFAYSPATSSGMNTESFQINNTDNKVTINYEVNTDYQRQEDFMVATNLDSKSNPTRLNFKHVLSAAKFMVRGNEYDNDGKVTATFRVKEIKLVNLHSQGILVGTAGEETITGKTSNWAWSVLPESTKTYTVYQKYPIDTPEDETYIEIGDMIVLPQEPKKDIVTPANSFKIIITYNVVGSSTDKTTEFTLADDFIFEMGRKYTLYLNLN